MSPIDVALLIVASILLACLVVGLWRAVRGPSTEDRLMAFVLLGSSGAALFAVLGTVMDSPPLRDSAIILVALATVVVLVFTRRTER